MRYGTRRDLFGRAVDSRLFLTASFYQGRLNHFA